MKTTTNIEQEFEFLLYSDAGDPQEVRLRQIAGVTIGLLLFLGTGVFAFAVWGVVNLLIDWSYVRFLKRTTRPVSPRRFWFCVSYSIVLATWIGALPVVLAIVYDGQFLYVSYSIVVVFALHAIARNSSYSISAKIGLTAVLISGAGVATSATLASETIWAGAAIMFSGICAIIFFVFSFRQIVQDRAQLEESRQQEIQDQKMRSLGRLTSGIAHDFNNLLTVIGGNLELAKVVNKHSSGEVDEFLDEALLATERGSALVSHLLAHGRKSKLKAQVWDLGDILENLREGLLRVLPANTELDMSLPAKPVFVWIDRPMLESAVLNLVINARDAVGSDLGRISVSVIPNEDPDLVLIAVDDTGPGMPEYDLQRAADPFFTTKAVGEGSGLGLSLVSGFLDQSGGQFALKNREEGGVRAMMYVPKANGAETIATGSPLS